MYCISPNASVCRATIVVASIGLLGTTAHAQIGVEPARPDDARPWMVALSATRDQGSYEHLAASFHFGFSDATWLSLAAGRSRAPSAETDVRANLKSLGLEHDFGPVGVGLVAEHWGDDNNLEASDWLGTLFFRGDNYRVDLTRKQRDIDVFFSGAGAPVLTDLRRVNVDADGTGLRWRYRFSPLWRAYGSWTDYDYPPRLHLIPRASRLDLLSTSTVTLAYSFVDYLGTVGVERTVGRKLVNLDFSQDRSAIDNGKLKSASVSVLWPVGRRMDLEFRVGSARPDGFESTYYGGFTLLVYGGG
jgi:hypothetical protein